MDDLERQLIRAKWRKRLVIGAALLVVLVSPCLFYAYGYWEQTRPSPFYQPPAPAEPSGPVGPVTAEQRAAVDAALAAFEAQLDAEVGPWRDAMAGGASAVADPSAGRCPFEVPLPRSTVTSSERIPGGLVGFTRGGGEVFFATSRERAFDYHVVREGVVPEEPRLVARMRGRAGPIREAIARDATAEEHEATVAQAERLRTARPIYEVTVFERARVPPQLTQEEFDPGLVEATAVIYDYRDHAIACAAEVRARPSAVTFIGGVGARRPDFERALDLVLEDALEREVSRSMQFRARLAVDR